MKADTVPTSAKLLGVAIIGVSLLIACGSDPVRPGPLRVGGRTFNVISLDGQRLPVDVLKIGRPGCYMSPIVRATVSFRVDGSVHLTHWTLPDEIGSGSTFATSWTQDSTGAVFVSNASSVAGTFQGDTLVLPFTGYGPFCLPYVLRGVVQP